MLLQVLTDHFAELRITMFKIILCITIWLYAATVYTADNQPSAEQQAVLAVVQQVFDAIAERDPQLWRDIQLEQGVAIAMRPIPDSPEFRMQLRSNAELVNSIKPDGRQYLEQFTAEPTVLIRGPIAVVWGEYDFWIDGEFSHCGVDAIDLVKLDGQWKIANFMWTMEQDNCPTRPDH